MRISKIETRRAKSDIAARIRRTADLYRDAVGDVQANAARRLYAYVIAQAVIDVLTDQEREYYEKRIAVAASEMLNALALRQFGKAARREKSNKRFAGLYTRERLDDSTRFWSSKRARVICDYAEIDFDRLVDEMHKAGILK